MIWRIIKFLIVLAALGGIALVGYAYVGPIFFADDFAPPSRQVVEPVVLETR